ncbi:MAG: T9SS type A sorting domain-containing protein, partial [candidate division KSB1 bacterium]|nr:T9SS type A sorting domain-containing protein [candidate division KSB1 bacterium]
GRFASDHHYVYGSGSGFASQSQENAGAIVVAIPEQLSLSQNFPNPFNPVTTISYKLSIDSYVTMKIYDVLGREVMTLVNDRLKAGSYETHLDASLLPSGVYVYRIEALGEVKLGKLLLQKFRECRSITRKQFYYACEGAVDGFGFDREKDI